MLHYALIFRKKTFFKNVFRYKIVLLQRLRIKKGLSYGA